MRNRRMTKVAVLATSLLISIFTVNATECTVGKAAVMPVAEKHGSAGAFIGKVGDIVLIAGGSDFENAKAWAGVCEYILRNFDFLSSIHTINILFSYYFNSISFVDNTYPHFLQNTSP